MSGKSVRGRSDLVRIGGLARDRDVAQTAFLAEALGFEFKPQIEIEKTSSKATAATEQGADNRPHELKQPLAPLPFLVPLEFQALDEPQSVRTAHRPPVDPIPEVQVLRQPPVYRPLANFGRLAPQLQKALSIKAKAGKPDIKKTVRLLAEARTIQKLPLKERLQSPQTIQIVVDRSRHLVPIWNDQLHVVSYVRNLFPNAELAAYVFDEREGACRKINEEDRYPETLHPETGPLLVLGDLGYYRPERSQVRTYWARIAEQFFKAENRAVVLFPGMVSSLPDRSRALCSVLNWEGRRDRKEERDDGSGHVQRLLTYASAAVRVEPGLLRALRDELVEQADVSAEIAFWADRALFSQSSVAATLQPKSLTKYRAKFAQRPFPEQKKALEIIRQWRLNLPDEIYYEELVNLPAAAKRALEQDENFASDYTRARAYFERVCGALKEQQGDEGTGLRAWLSRVGGRATEAWQEDALREAVTEVMRLHDPNYNPPVAPDKVNRPGVNVEQVDLSFSGKGIGVEVSGGAASEIPGMSGSPLARLPSKNGVVELTEWRAAEGFPAHQFWEAGVAPGWAEDWGVDQFGPWAVFSVTGQTAQNDEEGRAVSNKGLKVAQKLCWIPPGQFQMGSPEDEPGRYDVEGPQHERIIEHGLWLFDTPVTQALWLAVMEDNPSEFVNLEQPVENVSFDDAHAFLEKLNGRLPGLDLGLPSEAEWEYACRAGVGAATYAGPMEILGENNAPVLDDIAWYGGNSGRDFDLEDGYDTSDWEEKRYPEDAKAGTRITGQKKPNTFGLYDMLGNVLEWCLDEWHDSYEGAPHDGSAWLSRSPKQDEEGRASRVVRGGSWSFDAQGVRSAYRNGIGPSRRVNFLGFRCAGGRVEPGKPVARSAMVSSEPGKARLVTRGRSRVELAGGLPGGSSGTAPGDRGEWKRAVVDPSNRQATLDLETLPAGRMQIRTDKAALTLEPMTKPAWANAFGRDRFGLYADLKIEDVTQKLRWIPPGGFLMGSPEDEPGRWSDEGPQHYVVIGHGYWLFDTPVTQDLWQALMGENPSEFQHPKRPVEMVDWDQACAFAAVLTGRVPELLFELPSETEWEYACRAGTSAATYAGPMEIFGERNAPILDEVAWYGGNSGQDFDLEKGYDTTGWKEKQYPDYKQAGTRIVGLKKPNAFGLYDMLGNVREWCADEWHASYKGAPEDGSSWEGQATEQDNVGRADRVVRGGSWDVHARHVRSAYRDGYGPSGRIDGLGFRCAGGPVELRQAARSAGSGLASDARAETLGSGLSQAADLILNETLQKMQINERGGALNLGYPERDLEPPDDSAS